jgi:hypothetical protein
MTNVTLFKYMIFVGAALLVSVLNAVTIWFIVYSFGFIAALIYFALSILIFFMWMRNFY